MGAPSAWIGGMDHTKMILILACPSFFVFMHSQVCYSSLCISALVSGQRFVLLHVASIVAMTGALGTCQRSEVFLPVQPAAFYTMLQLSELMSLVDVSQFVSPW